MKSKVLVEIIIMFIILLVSAPCFSQSSTLGGIRGFVVDATNEEPLPAVNIVMEGQRRGASTNLDGYFVIDRLKPGVYQLMVTYIGYHPKKEEVVVTNQMMEPISIQLLPSDIELEEVIVEVSEENELETRMSPMVSNIPVDVTTIRKMPSFGAEMDVLRAMQVIPGVKASSDVSSGIYVRGGSPDQTLILMDHNVVYNPSHLFGLFSTFNADAVKRINLLKGGFPAEYGGRSGSVLEVITNEGNRKESEGMISLGIVSARGSYEGPLPNDKGSYAVSARRTYMDPLLAAMGSDLPKYYFYDGNGKLNLDITSKSTLTIAGYWGGDHLDWEMGPANNKLNLYLTWGNRTLTSRYRQVLSRNLFLSVNAAVSRYRSKWGIENGGVVMNETYDRIFDYSLKSDLEYMGNENHRIKTGISVNRYDFTLNIVNYDLNQVDIRSESYLFSMYVEDVWRAHPLFEIKPGLRSYYFEDGDYFRLDPRLALLYHYDVNMRFKIAGGRYSQFINLINYGELMSSFDIWVPVEKSVEPSYSDQIVLGFEMEPREDLEFTLEGYYTRMQNLTDFDWIQIEESEDADDAFLTGGEGFAYGVELMLRQTKGRATGWIGYSLSWTKRRFDDTYLNNGDWYFPIWDRRHDFVTMVNYALTKNWDISGTWRFNTGQGYTQPLGMVTNRFAGASPDLVEDGGRSVVNGSLNNYRFPADHRLDLNATYKHHFFKLPANLNISIYNAYSRRSYWRRTINFEENPVDISDAKLLPILPMVSYEVRF